MQLRSDRGQILITGSLVNSMVQTVAGCDSQLGTEGGQIGLHAWTKRRPARISSFYEAEASFGLSDLTSRRSARFVAIATWTRARQDLNMSA